MIKILLSILFTLSFISPSFAGDQEYISKCSSAVRKYTHITVDEFSYEYDSHLFSPDIIKWSNVECVIGTSGITDLKINGQYYIEDSMVGLGVKTFYISLVTRTRTPNNKIQSLIDKLQLKINSLKHRQDYLDTTLSSVSRKLKSEGYNKKKLVQLVDHAVIKSISNLDNY